MAGIQNISEADLRATAYHEAGHCVAEIVYGRTLRYVTIIPGKRKNARGQVMAGRALFRRPRGVQSREQKKTDFTAALMGCYAGVICESAATGKPVDQSSIADDHKAAVDMVSAFLGGNIAPERLQSVLSVIYQETLRFLVSPRIARAVRYVADALIVRRTLTGGEVNRLILQAFNAAAPGESSQPAPK